MNWTELLKTEIEVTFETTAKLLDKVDPDSLDWKPPNGSNWMTVGSFSSTLPTPVAPHVKHLSPGIGGCPKV